MIIFNDFDVSDFWADSDYARKEYVEAPPTDSMVASVETDLGFQLPASYLELMRTQNGGLPNKTCFPTKPSVGWADDHVAIFGIKGIGREKRYSLLGEIGSQFMQQGWGYPTWGVCICDCPSSGHDMIMLDYRGCGPEGEPQVVHVAQEFEFEVTLLAQCFEEFIRRLVPEAGLEAP